MCHAAQRERNFRAATIRIHRSPRTRKQKINEYRKTSDAIHRLDNDMLLVGKLLEPRAMGNNFPLHLSRSFKIGICSQQDIPLDANIRLG